MESYAVKNQIQDIKFNLIRFIQGEINVNKEVCLFSNPIIFLYMDKPDMLCNVYGVKNGGLLFDSHNPMFESLDLNSLPIEILIKIKEQLEFDAKNKEYQKQ